MTSPGDVLGPRIIHKVKSKLGHTIMHTAAPGFGEDELVAADDNQKNWKGITIAFLVIMVILSSVAVSVVILTPPDDGDLNSGKKFNLKDIVSHSYAVKPFNGSWISENELIYLDAYGSLTILNLDSMQFSEILSNKTLKMIQLSDYSLSPDRKFLLIKYNTRKRYRYSSFAQYTIIELSTRATWEVRTNRDDGTSPTFNSQPRLLYAHWMPNVPSGVLFVENFAIYYVPKVSEKTKKLFPISPPDSVVEEIVIHGIPDWIYEENILKRPHCIWPSPNGKKVVYATFNDTQVGSIEWPLFGDASSHPYPQTRSMKYPRAGTTNPTVQLWMVHLDDLSSIRSTLLRPPTKTFNFKDYYFTAISWASNSENLAINWMNREQNVAIVSECKLKANWICSESFRETSMDSWTTLYSPPLFSKDSNSYLVKALVRDGKSGFFQQIVLVENSDLIHPLVIDHTEVKDILGWDEEDGLIYFMAIPTTHPSQQHLYTITSDWKRRQTLTCLTCTIQSEELSSRKCFYNKILLSPSYANYVLECLGPSSPGVFLVQTSPIDNAESNITTNSSSFLPSFVLMALDERDRLRKVSREMVFANIELMDIPVESEYEAPRIIKAKLYKPKSLVKTEALVKYPLVLHVYSGPGYQLVTDQWKVDFNAYMASNLNYLVLEVDGIGSGGQGHDHLAKIKGQLGQAEVQDQLYALKYIREHLGFVDPDRIAVTGVSYGGYVSIRLLSEEDATFLKCAVAVSPVVDWRFYESAYSERYLGMPNSTNNVSGYEKSSLIGRSKNLKKNKSLLLVHGLADRNVHFQHGMILAKELIRNEVLFEHQVYPDEGHFLENVQLHLFSTVSQFLQDCFQINEDHSQMSSE